MRCRRPRALRAGEIASCVGLFWLRLSTANNVALTTRSQNTTIKAFFEHTASFGSSSTSKQYNLNTPARYGCLKRVFEHGFGLNCVKDAHFSLRRPRRPKIHGFDPISKATDVAFPPIIHPRSFTKCPERYCARGFHPDDARVRRQGSIGVKIQEGGSIQIY